MSQFFDTSPITNCAITSCNYGDTCGTGVTIANANIDESAEASDPYTLKYSQDVLDGYGPVSLCLYCESTNDYTDQYTFTIQQDALDCDSILVANA